MVSKIVLAAKKCAPYAAPIALSAAAATLSPTLAGLAIVAGLAQLGHKGKLSTKTAVYYSESTQLNPLAVKTDALEIADRVHAQAIQTLSQIQPPPPAPQPVQPVAAAQQQPAPAAEPAPAASQPYAWRPETKQQIDDLSVKLSCLTTLSTMNWICGINTPSETLMQLSATASKNEGSLWKLFKHQTNLSWWQLAVGGVVYLFSGIIDKVVKTYVSEICTEMVHQATHRRDPKEKANMTRSFLARARDFLTAYNKINEDFAKGECGTLSLQAAQIQQISSKYSGSEKSLQELEKSKALRSLCEQFIDTLLSEASPSVPEYGKTANWMIHKLIRRIVPAQLQSLVASGIDYTNPQNLSFAIQREKFLAKQIGSLQATLSSESSGPPPQVEGIEELPTVVEELLKMIMQSKNTSASPAEGDSRESVQKRLSNKSWTYSALSTMGLKQKAQGYLVLGCTHALDYLSNPNHVEKIVHNLTELMLESFAPNLVRPDLLILNFEPANLIKDIDEKTDYVSKLKQFHQIQDVFGQDPLRPGMEAVVDGIAFKVETSGLISYKISLERLQKMKEVAGEHLQTASSDCFKRIGQKVSGATRESLGQSQNAELLEQNAENILKTQQRSAQGIVAAFPILRQKIENFETIQPEISLFFEQLSALTNVKTLKTDLNKLPRPEKEAIARALRPLYVGSEQLLGELTTLQTAQNELTELQKEEEKQTELLRLFALKLENPFTLIEQLKALNEAESFNQMKGSLDDSQNWLNTLENILTHLEEWRKNPLLFNRYPKSLQIGNLIQGLPSGEDRDGLLRMAAELWKEKNPTQILIRYKAFIQRIETLHITHLALQQTQISQAQDWIRNKTEEAENFLKFSIGRRHGKKEEILSILSLLENSVEGIRKEIEKIKLSPYSKWSNKDLAKLLVNRVLGAFIGWMSPISPIVTPLIVETAAEKMIPEASEELVFSELSDLAFRAYEQLGSPIMSYAIATGTMKSFVDGKRKTLV